MGADDPIESMLIEMKNNSEMMIDLAYSALIYGNVDVARHVLDLEVEMDHLHTRFELAVLQLRQAHPLKSVLGLIRLGLAAENIADAAAMIADVAYRGVAPHPVLRMALEEAEETVLTTTLAPNSPLVGHSLGELGLDDDIGMRVIAVRRRGKWAYKPPDSTTLRSGDTVIARGYAEGRERLLQLANP